MVVGGVAAVVGNETGFRSEGMNHLRLIDRWAHQMRDEFFRSEGMDHLRLIVKPLIGRSGLFGSHMRTNQGNGFSKRRDGPPPSKRPLGAVGHWWLRESARGFIKWRGLVGRLEGVSLFCWRGRYQCVCPGCWWNAVGSEWFYGVGVVCINCLGGWLC
jgi:hypothetical protein